MVSVLIVGEAAAQAGVAGPQQAWQQALLQALPACGVSVAGQADCGNLVREAVRLAPEVIVALVPVIDAPLLASLGLLQQGQARPVLLVGPPRLQLPEADPAPARGLAAGLATAGVQAWLPGQPTPEAVADALQWALQRQAAEQRQASELAGALTRLDERKWVDRAKGLLMSTQPLSEDQAFAVLRTASMHANLRLGEVSRALVAAARTAEAVNRAGLLRMLSQRLIKALALHLAGVERHRAEALLADSLQRVQASLVLLAGLALEGLAARRLQAADAAWRELQVLLEPEGLDAARLHLADQRAETLLAAADALTSAIEQAGGRPHLRLVNQCGRQRMLAQRLAKQVLLAGLLDELLDGAAGAEAAQEQQQQIAATVAEFDGALAWLERAPLTTDEIRRTLATARGQWQRMLDGVRRAAIDSPPHEARRVLGRESEALLDSFDSLTSLYEHSLQGLMA